MDHFIHSLSLGALALGLFAGGARAQVGCIGQRADDLPSGYFVIEGDIQVREDHCLLEGVFETNLWPNGEVPFLFSGNTTASNQSQALIAMEYWEDVANVHFVPWSGEFNFVLIQDSTANNSALGMQGGIQVVNITSWSNTYIIAHEFGHLLGLHHEHKHPNQSAFVQVNLQNVCQNCCVDSQGNPASCNSQFTIQPTASTYGPYDFDSVMHYGQFAFSTNPGVLQTITVLPPNTAWQNLIGQRTHLSEWDGRIMSFLYPFSNHKFVDRTDGGTFNLGTFFEPFSTLALGIFSTPTGGTVWILNPSDYSDTGVFDRAMTLRAPIGGVVIGS